MCLPCFLVLVLGLVLLTVRLVRGSLVRKWSGAAWTWALKCSPDLVRESISVLPVWATVMQNSWCLLLRCFLLRSFLRGSMFLL